MSEGAYRLLYPRGSRTPALRLGHGGETQVFSSMRKKAGKSTFLGASVRNTKAQQKPDRAAGHLSSASSPESRRGGGRRCSVAFSITARRRPRFLQALSHPISSTATDCPPPRGFCATLQRRLRNPSVLLAADVAPLRALTTWLQTKAAGRLELDTVRNPQSGIMRI